MRYHDSEEVANSEEYLIASLHILVLVNVLHFSKPCVPTWGIYVENVGRFFLFWFEYPMTVGKFPGRIFAPVISCVNANIKIRKDLTYL